MDNHVAYIVLLINWITDCSLMQTCALARFTSCLFLFTCAVMHIFYIQLRQGLKRRTSWKPNGLCWANRKVTCSAEWNRVGGPQHAHKNAPGIVYLAWAQNTSEYVSNAASPGFCGSEEMVKRLAHILIRVTLLGWTLSRGWDGFVFLLQCLPRCCRFTAAPFAACSEQLQGSLLASRDPKYVHRYLI